MDEKNVVGKIPEFDTDEGIEEVNQAPTDEVVEEEAQPAEPPAAEEADAPDEPDVVVDQSEDIQRALTGLQNERAKLLREISELKGARREIKQEQITRVEERMDELKDVNPADVTLIDRVLRAKGFVTKEEASGMFHEAVKEEELQKFLDRYPEYKPENDPGDVNWGLLQREIGYYRAPKDPRIYAEILERAHRGIARAPAVKAEPMKRRQAEIASVGGGGMQRNASRVPMDARRRAYFENGGWSNEEIDRMERGN